MDTNGLHIVTYNCKNCTTDGDKFEFIKLFLKTLIFCYCKKYGYINPKFHNPLKLDNYCDFFTTRSMN